MKNEELLDKIMYSQVPTVTILERGEYRAELLRRLGVAVSASPQPDFKVAVIEILANCAYRYVHPESVHRLDPQSVIDKQIDNGVETLKKFFAAAPVQEPRIGEPCPTCERKYLGKMGPGDYSCCVCGMGMLEPCEHWKLFEESAAQEQPVENSPQNYFCSNCVQYLTEREAMDAHDQSHDIVRVIPEPSPQKGKP